MNKANNLKTASLFLLPSSLLFLIFVFLPLFNTIYTSLFLTDVAGHRSVFDGLGNYIRLFESSVFQTGFWATLIFVLIIVPVTLLLSLGLAYLTLEHFKGVQLFRTIFSSSMGVSVAAGSIFWLFIFNPKGLINSVLSGLNLPAVGWLTTPSLALIAIAIATIWMNTGFAYLILLGGMQGVDPSLYEASRIAGVKKWTEFRRITLPMISPSLYFVLTISVIQAFQVFGQIDLLTKGGPSNATSLLTYQIYQDAFLNYNQGRASAGAVILFLLVLVVTLLQSHFSSRKVHYQ
ncbi:carbohydrate ABC transporter permease [Lactococcus termiticola]|uniref:Glycerol-3-phosphate ABC transporter permease protein n=1 Tax=Lactococcus termiticola TaxID=2169526 RepID=A0A2R5HIL3_9LACT|nr:sugar ABC transporter permease [Lactococcus termiticola]GBG97435.1 glycerol-3-phosphate ABC transporter permease protein [Lactococcus termiticola]